MKVIVVGGGAAGMMAAIHAASLGNKVILLEKNEKLGKKIYITGKGRCNVTNAADMETIFNNIKHNAKFMYSSLYTYDNNMVYSFFEENGCPLKIERGDRVFPVSDHASDIIKALIRALNDNHVEVRLNTHVKTILENDGIATGVLLKSGERIDADKVILATGGFSYQTTGSNGEGYKMAESLGHNILEPKPSLVPVVTGETWVPDLQGLSLKNVELKLVKDHKKVLYKELGEMLFTHFGVSGPLVLSLSAIYNDELEKGSDCMLYLDLKPGLTMEQLDKRILKDFEENKNKHFKNSLDDLLPQKMIPIIVKLSNIEPEKKVNEVSKEERKNLCELLKALPMTPVGLRGFNEAIITRGGINVKEINASTMESKLIKNLYFAGEVIDVDALTGGFNLQIAWSTGYLAGMLS